MNQQKTEVERLAKFVRVWLIVCLSLAGAVAFAGLLVLVLVGGSCAALVSSANSAAHERPRIQRLQGR